MRRLAVLVVLMLLILTGCVRKAGTPSGPVTGGQSGGADQTASTGNSGPTSPDGTKAATLFPSADLALRFDITDKDSSQVTEYLVRDDERVIAGYDGKAYATWFVRESGIWRMDPKGGGALLRYLPPVLESGLAWSQGDGKDKVWFYLDEGTEYCRPVAGAFDTETCWRLTVLNRGERSIFLFTQGNGPVYARAENWVDTALSFEKKGARPVTPQWSSGQRSAYLAQAVTNPAPEAAVTQVTVVQFQNAVQNAFGGWRNVTEFQGTGEGEIAFLIGAVAGTWTDKPYLLYRRDLTLIDMEWPPSDQRKHRITPLTPVGVGGTWLLSEQQLKGSDDNQISMRSPRGKSLWGLAYKITATRGSRVGTDETGKLIIWWDLGDPARHTMIREYRLDNANPDMPAAKLLTTRLVPQGKALREPTTAEEVLKAAFIAVWYDATDEIPRYFASPEVAKVLTGNPEIGEPAYGPGSVEVGMLTYKEISTVNRGTIQIGEIQPAPVGPDGTAGFVAEIPYYEGGNTAWGRVTFGRDPTGRVVITKLVVEGAGFIY